MLHIVQDSGAAEIICGPEYIAAAQALARDVTGDRHVRVTVLAPETAEAQRGCITPRQRRSVAAVLSGSLGPAIAPEGDALIIYTSGTTSKPKGAVHSHSSVSNQCRVLLEAWRWTASDTILHTLPLHHVHGLINVLCCAIAAGARCEFFGAPSGKFDAAAVARRVAAGDVSLFMSVPPAYKKIEAAVRNWSASEQKAWRAACKAHVRLMVSGSSALPVPVLRSFDEVSGHRLLERYGMTEIGMALSQPLAVAARRPGTVGLPLPGVACRLAAPTADASEKDVAAGAELLIQSKSMFSRYWRQPSKTAEAFTRVPGEAGLWFLTGDNVAVDPATGAYTILGRASADIIKNSGYKISALEVENALMNTGLLEECAVLADPEAAASGSDSIVALVVVPAATAGRGSAVTKTEAAIRSALSESLSHYKRPREYIWLPAGIPRNAMGKVNKKALALQLATLRKSATR
jgi:malonyl-CoA/methylmalonyl-CoA synthetase